MKKWKNAKGDELVCYCLKVDKQALVTSIKEGNDTLLKIQEETGACTGGQCKELNPTGKCCAEDINALIEIYGEGALGNSSYDCCK